MNVLTQQQARGRPKNEPSFGSAFQGGGGKKISHKKERREKKKEHTDTG